METALGNSAFSSLVFGSEDATNRNFFSETIKDRGIDMALITYREFAYGEPVAGKLPPYRKFLYDENGRVIKKLDFDSVGKIETKMESTFNSKGKVTASTIYTPENISEELYGYDDTNGRLISYSFNNNKWPRPKTDEYEYDKFGRKNKKISYGLIGEPELVTEYLYDTDKDRKVSYRYVTTPDGALILTLLYYYDSKKQNQTALYSFLKTPGEIEAFRNDPKKLHTESISASFWEFDTNGNHTSFVRDEVFSSALKNLLLAAGKFDPATGRTLTEKYTNAYEKINGRFYLVKTTEWLIHMNEPLQAVKEYAYFNKKGEQLYPVEPAASK